MLRNIRQFNYVDSAMDRNAEWNGWRMVDMDHFDPGEGYTIAHDALEHFTKNETTLEQEMMAFGAMIYGRVKGGWWYGNNGMYAGREGQVIMGDIARFLYEQDWTIKPRKGCRIHEDVQEYVEDRDTFAHEVLGNQYNEASGYRGRAAAYNAYIQCMRWVSVGYRKASRRWAGHSHYSICEFFQNVTKAIDRFKHGEHGDLLTVRWSNKTLEFRVNHTPAYEFVGDNW